MPVPRDVRRGSQERSDLRADVPEVLGLGVGVQGLGALPLLDEDEVPADCPGNPRIRS